MVSINVMPQVILTKKIIPLFRARLEKNPSVKCAIMTTSSRNASNP